MPTHVYQPLRNPPSWRDRLLVHPMDTTVALVAIVFAVLVALSILVPEFIPSKSMDKMPWAVVILVSGFLGTGGLLALIGLNWAGDNVSKGWALERLGWLLAAGGFITYALSVSWHYPASVFSWGVPLSLGAGAALRCWSIVLIEKSTRRTIAEVKGRDQ
ncbi:hypothetical protein [Arthrobacter sp. lap29]|uniref:hypothetical protein n=1 Tax=Arthrobacter sp. lap29 TaxID=3056122 RepID=UPI0028F70333|nr:hypothetical protein [Arthrobacter sp. lap29]